MVWTAEEQKEHRRLWVEALRSGRYQQATRQLRVGDAMCCLGVACDISGLGQWDDVGCYLVPGEPFAITVLPDGVRDWIGLNKSDSFYNGGQLTLHNDEGKTFTEIADIIESEPTGLVKEPS